MEDMKENPSADEPAAPLTTKRDKNDTASTLVAEAEQHDADAAAEVTPAMSPAVEASGSEPGSTRVSAAGADAHPAEATAPEGHDTADVPSAAAADGPARGDKAEAAALEPAEHSPDSSAEAPASAAEVAAEGSHAAHTDAEASKQRSSSSSSGGSPSSSSSSTEESHASKEPEKAAKKSDAGTTAAVAAAAAVHAAPKAPAAKNYVELEPAEQHTKVASPRHKETAAARLTTPTAMRMLKTLEQTQGGKAEWHIATGVPFKSKKLAPDEMAAMVDRLCTPKHAEDNMPPKPHAVKLVFEGTKEVLVPVKETSKEDNITYMSSLYERCQETRAKTMQTLQEKWLQPLIKPKQAAK